MATCTSSPAAAGRKAACSALLGTLQNRKVLQPAPSEPPPPRRNYRAPGDANALLESSETWASLGSVTFAVPVSTDRFRPPSECKHCRP